MAEPRGRSGGTNRDKGSRREERQPLSIPPRARRPGSTGGGSRDTPTPLKEPDTIVGRPRGGIGQGVPMPKIQPWGRDPSPYRDLHSGGDTILAPMEQRRNPKGDPGIEGYLNKYAGGDKAIWDFFKSNPDIEAWTRWRRRDPNARGAPFPPEFKKRMEDFFDSYDNTGRRQVSYRTQSSPDKPAYTSPIEEQWGGFLGPIKKGIDELRFTGATRDEPDITRLLNGAADHNRSTTGFPRAGILSVEDWVGMGRPRGREGIIADMPGPGSEKMALGRGDETQFLWIDERGVLHGLTMPEGMNPNEFFNPDHLRPLMEKQNPVRQASLRTEEEPRIPPGSMVSRPQAPPGLREPDAMERMFGGPTDPRPEFLPDPNLGALLELVKRHRPEPRRVQGVPQGFVDPQQDNPLFKLKKWIQENLVD